MDAPATASSATPSSAAAAAAAKVLQCRQLCVSNVFVLFLWLEWIQ